MSHYSLFACLKSFDEACKLIRHKNRNCSMKLDQDYHLIMLDKRIFSAPPNMDDKQAKV
jgi:hypothetical protein